MDPKQIVEHVLRFNEVSPLPYYIPVCESLELELKKYYGKESLEEILTPYLFCEHFGFREVDYGNGRQIDPFGVITENGSILHVLQSPLHQPSLSGYNWPNPETFEDWEILKEKYEQKSASFRLTGLGFGLYERAWLLRGMENLLVDMIENPFFVEELMDGILDFHMKILDISVQKIPFEAYFGGDDWSDQRGPMMGVKLWRRFIKPRLAKLIKRCHEHNLRYICHSCGNVLPLVDDLLEIGLDGLESLQPEAMDVFTLKKKTCGRMALIGGMGVQTTMPYGTTARIREETDMLIREMGKGGGYIPAPAKPLLEDVPVENAAAFIDAVKNSQV